MAAATGLSPFFLIAVAGLAGGVGWAAGNLLHRQPRDLLLPDILQGVFGAILCLEVYAATGVHAPGRWKCWASRSLARWSRWEYHTRRPSSFDVWAVVLAPVFQAHERPPAGAGHRRAYSALAEMIQARRLGGHARSSPFSHGRLAWVLDWRPYFGMGRGPQFTDTPSTFASPPIT